MKLQLPASPFNDDICYAAMQSHDARFDGVFFVGVTSTGIYCRPICRVRIPKRENCRFFTHSAVAEGLGFRACMRCRPECAPPQSAASMLWTSEDASKTLAVQALQLIDASKGAWNMREVAKKMGITDRHLRRIFTAQWGLSPLAYAQTRRAQWTPKDLQLALPVQMPYDKAHLLAFFALRAIPGVEHVDAQQHLWRSVQLSVKRKRYTGWVCADLSSSAGGKEGLQNPARSEFACDLSQSNQRLRQVQSERNRLAQIVPDQLPIHLPNHLPFHLPITISASLVPVLAQLVPLLRAALDVDAPADSIDAHLLRDFPGTSGQRVPGCFDGFELAVRAVLGQQITVKAARTLSQRLVERLGDSLLFTASPSKLIEHCTVPFDTQGASDAIDHKPLTRLFPTATQLAKARPALLGELGIVKTRQVAIQGLAQAVVNGLDLSAKPRSTLQKDAVLSELRAIKGIGDWTAQYIAMRALREPDAFPAGDVALHHALQVKEASVTQSSKAAAAQSQRWQPWRSYAVIRAWGRLNPAAKETG